jgi:hypothetical protein
VTIVWLFVAFYVGMFAGVLITGLARAAGEKAPQPVEASVKHGGRGAQDHEFAA